MPAVIKGKHYLTQGYGLTKFAKEHPSFYKNFPGGIHPGVDFGTGGINLPVISPVKGKVVMAKLDGGWGNHVGVLGEDGWIRQFAHLQSISVHVGQEVEIGDELGKVGNTGSSTAVHLHFGNRRWSVVKWEYRDPSGDLQEKIPQPKKIKGPLIKADNSPAVYIYNGEMIFPVPSWETLEFLFGKSPAIEVVSSDIVSKLPMGPLIPLIK